MNIQEEFKKIRKAYHIDNVKDKDVNLYDSLIDYDEKNDYFDIEEFVSELNKNSSLKEQFRSNYNMNYGDFKYTNTFESLFLSDDDVSV